MDLRLALRQTIKLVVPSPKGDLVSVAFLSRHSRAGLWILPSLSGLVCGTDLWSDKLVVPSPKGDLVSVAFLSRHSRAGLWILPSLSGLVCGLVCGKDLWSDGTGSLLEALKKRPTQSSGTAFHAGLCAVFSYRSIFPIAAQNVETPEHG